MSKQNMNGVKGSDENVATDTLLAVDEAKMARMMDVSPEHLGNLAREGAVPHIKLGRRTLFSVRAMDDFLYEQAMSHLESPGSANGATNGT